MQVFCSVCFLSLLWPVTRLPCGLHNCVMNCYMLVIVCQSGYLLQKQLPERKNKQKKQTKQNKKSCAPITRAVYPLSPKGKFRVWAVVIRTDGTLCNPAGHTVVQWSANRSVIKLAGLFSIPATENRSFIKIAGLFPMPAADHWWNRRNVLDASNIEQIISQACTIVLDISNREQIRDEIAGLFSTPARGNRLSVKLVRLFWIPAAENRSFIKLSGLFSTPATKNRWLLKLARLFSILATESRSMAKLTWLFSVPRTENRSLHGRADCSTAANTMNSELTYLLAVRSSANPDLATYDSEWIRWWPQRPQTSYRSRKRDVHAAVEILMWWRLWIMMATVGAVVSFRGIQTWLQNYYAFKTVLKTQVRPGERRVCS